MAIIVTSKGTALGTGSAVLNNLTIAAGSTIIVCVGEDTGDDGVITCTYNDGTDNHSLTERIGIDNGDRRGFTIFSLDNVSAASGSGSITATTPLPNNAISLCAYQVTGLESAGSYDKSAGATDRDTSFDSGTTTTTSQADELIIGGVNPSVETVTLWTGTVTENIQTVDNSNGSCRSATKIVSSTGTYNAAGNLSAKEYWAAAVATFKAATDGGPANLKSVDGVLKANITSIGGVAIGSIKSIVGIE